MTSSYYIRAEYSYYSGTCYAPSDGPLTDGYGQRMDFSSREEAAAYLTESTEFGDGMGCERIASGKYSFAGTYICGHGEFARPLYTVRKVAMHRIKWGTVRNIEKRSQLQRYAKRLRGEGKRVQLNYHGGENFSLDAFRE